MEIYTKVSGMKENEMVMVSLLRGMVITLKAIGLTIIVKDKVHISIVIRISFSLENGLMTNQKLVYTLK